MKILTEPLRFSGLKLTAIKPSGKQPQLCQTPGMYFVEVSPPQASDKANDTVELYLGDRLDGPFLDRPVWDSLIHRQEIPQASALSTLLTQARSVETKAVIEGLAGNTNEHFLQEEKRLGALEVPLTDDIRETMQEILDEMEAGSRRQIPELIKIFRALVDIQGSFRVLNKTDGTKAWGFYREAANGIMKQNHSKVSGWMKETLGGTSGLSHKRVKSASRQSPANAKIASHVKNVTPEEAV